MAFIPAFLASKLALPVVGAAAVGLGLWAGLEAIEIHGVPIIGGGLKEQVSTLSDSINNPDTGYIHRLDVAKLNVATLQKGLDTANGSIADARKRQDEAEARLAAALAVAGPLADALRKQAAGTLSAKRGGDACKSLDDLLTGAYK